MMHLHTFRVAARPARRATDSLARLLVPGVLVSLALPTDLAGAGQGGGEGGMGAQLFNINVGLSLWTVVVFLALLLILWKWAWGPILEVVEQREDRIQGALDEAAAKQTEAAKLLKEHKEQLADARRQAQEIIAEGKAAGEKVRREIEEKAREEGQAIVERARREIEREKDAALGELRAESVDLALAAAARLMGQKMDADQDRELVMGYLDDIVTEHAPEGGAEA